MCGIAGHIASPKKNFDGAGLMRMSKALSARGPDGQGVMGWNGERISVSNNATELPNGQVAFAHRRLSIIDTGSGGHQPMVSADKRYVISYNGEVYNYIELRSELEKLGHRFFTQSDTEVVLNAIITWGTSALNRFVGMFALALLDTQERTVLLARDQFGIKPLSYAVVDGGLVFASELPALLTYGNISRKADAEATYEYLRFGYSDRDAGTMFSELSHIPPAHYALIDLKCPDQIKINKYWSLKPEPVDISFNEAADHLRDLFIENVGLHLRSDVPVGAALSGGIDSSAVVMAMRHIQGHQLDLHTFTYVADDPSLNEENWADIAGLAAQATMHKVQPGSDDLIAGLDRLINVQGEPFGSTSIFAQSCLYKLVNKTGIKVTLDGQGADEMLAGYPSYYAARFASLIRQGHPVQALEFLKCAASQGNMSAMKILLRGGQYLLPAQLNGVARGLVGEGLIPTWMKGAWFEKRGVNPQGQQSTSGKNILHDELANTLLDKTIPALLRYQDRSAMSYSVECRVPFLTTKMAEFLFSLPEEFLISKKGETKAVFRQAMRGIVPDAILDRKDKIGFETPQQHWLGANKAWLSDALKCGDHLPVFNNKGFKAEQHRLLSGEQRNDSAAWRWINFTKWAAMFEVEFDA